MQEVWSNRTLCYPKQPGFGRVSDAYGDLMSLGYGENAFFNWFSLDCEQFLSPISGKASDPGGLLNMFSREVQRLWKKLGSLINIYHTFIQVSYYKITRYEIK